jgi:hypothetical protein
MHQAIEDLLKLVKTIEKRYNITIQFNYLAINNMPLNKKGTKIMKEIKKEYGKKTGEKVFYASKNKGTIKGVEKKPRKK